MVWDNLASSTSLQVFIAIEIWAFGLVRLYADLLQKQRNVKLAVFLY